MMGVAGGQDAAAAAGLAPPGLADAVFRRFFDGHTAVMYLVDPGSLRILDANRAAQDFYGYGRDAFRGLRLTDFNVISEGAIRRFIADAMASGRTYIQVKHRIANGGVRDVEVRSSPITLDDGSTVFFAIVHDVTERVQAEAQLRRERERLSALLTKSPIALAITRPRDSTVLYANERAGQLVGLPVRQVIGKRALDFYAHPEDRDRLLARFLRDGFIRDAEVELKSDGPDRRWGLVTFETYPSGDELNVIAWIYDITARKQAEAAIQAARDEAERASRTKSVFLAMMSHEIRTPLTDVVGMADLLLAGGVSEVQREYVETIGSSAQSLLTIVDDILDLSRLDAGRLHLEEMAVDLGDLVGRVLALLRPRAEEKGLALTVTMDEAVPRHVAGDPTRLRQVLLNLVSNAVKFTEQGTIAVTVDLAPRPGGAQGLRIAVSDTGIGMDESTQAGLFQEFTQGDASFSRRFGGSGLGLAICRKLVALMAGEIGVDSRPGQGSRFWFHLPLRPAEAPDPMAAGPQAPVRPLSVLVAEDNPVNRKVVEAILTRAGHQVRAVPDGAEAVRAVAEDGCFDVVLMDMRMPGMDGLEATRRIRALPTRMAATPIVAMTANAFKEDEARCLAAGMDAYLAKPVTAPALLAMLARTARP